MRCAEPVCVLIVEVCAIYCGHIRFCADTKICRKVPYEKFKYFHFAALISKCILIYSCARKKDDACRRKRLFQPFLGLRLRRRIIFIGFIVMFLLKILNPNSFSHCQYEKTIILCNITAYIKIRKNHKQRKI